MKICMNPEATNEQINDICLKVSECGHRPLIVRSSEQVVIAVVSRGELQNLRLLATTPGVACIAETRQPYKLVSRELKQQTTIVRAGDLEIGGKEFVVMAGPCSVETREQLLEAAEGVKAAGARVLRGGAYKPRSSPYDFQGLELAGLKLLAEASERTGLKIISEVICSEDIEVMVEHVDILQVGARNMQNFALLKKLGRTRRPVLLKRGMSSTINELLLAAEYIASSGNDQIILCERGIRTFETATRNTLDLAAVPLMKELSHLPVIVDPSHGTGVRSLICPASKAAVAVGADGLLIEVHANPDKAWSDGAQSITPAMLLSIMGELRNYVPLEARTLHQPVTYLKRVVSPIEFHPVTSVSAQA